MSYLSTLQSTAAYYGGEFRDLPAGERNDLLSEWLAAQPTLEPVGELPERTLRYLFRELAPELVRLQSRKDEPLYRATADALIDTLTAALSGYAKRFVENEYDEETAEPCDHGITVREFADIDALNAEMRS